MFFRLDSWELGLILLAVVLGATALGVVCRSLPSAAFGERSTNPSGYFRPRCSGSLVSFLRSGSSLAVGRHETRGAAVVDEANAIGTTYLRAQILAEPVQGPFARAAEALRRYEHPAVSKTVPAAGHKMPRLR